MTYATTNSAGRTLAQRFANLRADIARSLAQRAVYRATLRELQQLSPRELDDLGIRREDIKSVAAQAAYRK